jgi:4-hydroxyphenylpyruvate dioxygenase
VIALEVDDARQAWRRPPPAAPLRFRALESGDQFGRITTSSIAAYGDTIHTFVERGHYNGAFLPGFRTEKADTVARPTGLKHIDHMVGNVGWHAMDEWVELLRQRHGLPALPALRRQGHLHRVFSR